MITCPACSSQVPETSRFCSTCGTVLPNGDAPDATVAMDAAPKRATPPASSHPSRTRFPLAASGGARFAPGTMLAGRYQIVGLLGKGGMGEVYRANDLTLDQQVALKFLPASMATHPAMLARFHSEVRIARQVSHPNVCRVYDIGEVEGLLFLSMEYVDGEDLSSLLRRIGRLPTDKAVEFARKLCAGLSAAHEKGVIHRDLKPANVMIDSQGQVVIMDFGLAGVAEQMVGAEIGAGTPAYMAPEQLAGREVTVRSDIYALGLVLYEMFTGKRPFEGRSAAEQRRLQEESLPPSLTTLVKEIDPAIERVILRCLAPDPRARPASALAVAAALPGGDPLAAALAAGETPSPDLVAASGSTAGLKPWIAFSLAAFVAASLIALVVMGPMAQLSGVAPLELPPDALTQKAREYAASFGYPDRPASWERSYVFDGDVLRYFQRNVPAGERWNRIGAGQPHVTAFWYRQSPRLLEPSGGTVTLRDPPESVSGMWRMWMDTRGRLIEFHAVPPQVEDPQPSGMAIDWATLLRAAGIDPGKIAQTEPRWTPQSVADARVAWTAKHPDVSGVDVRLEAASWRGKPVYFQVVSPWTRPTRMQAFQQTTTNRALQIFFMSLAVSVLIAATLLSRHNVKRGRSDISGATRLAIFSGAVFFLIWILRGWHVAAPSEIGWMFENLAKSLLAAASSWVGYVAIEPFVRRHWPQAIVSWTRLLSGRLMDPLVGRDVLIGTATGCLWNLLWVISMLIEKPLGATPTGSDLGELLGARQTAASALVAFTNVLIQLLVMFFLMFVVRAIMRREWLAAVAYILLIGVVQMAQSTAPAWDAGFVLVIAVSVYLLITRGGFVMFLVALWVNYFVVQTPMTSDFSSWFSHATIFMMLVIAALAAWGTYAALAGTPIIRDELL
jgi:serine/threonine-protein kinase